MQRIAEALALIFIVLWTTIVWVARMIRGFAIWIWKEATKWTPQHYSAFAAFMALLVTGSVLFVQWNQLRVAMNAREPVITFHIGVAMHDPMPWRQELFIQPDSSIRVYNAGTFMRRLRVGAISMLMVNDTLPEAPADSVLRVPILYWWYPWERTDSTGTTLVAFAKAHVDMRPVPCRFDWPESIVKPRFRVRGVVHLVRIWYIDALEQPHYDFYAVSRSDYAKLDDEVGKRLWNEQEEKVDRNIVADLQVASGAEREPLTQLEIDNIAKRAITFGNNGVAPPAVEPDSTYPRRW